MATSHIISDFAARIALIGLLLTSVVCAQQENTFSEFISVMADAEKLNEKLTQLAQNQAVELRALVLKARTHETAQEALKFYTANEMVFVEHSFKLGLHQPLDTYRDECSAALAEINGSFGLQPSYPLIERGLRWLEKNSRY